MAAIASGGTSFIHGKSMAVARCGSHSARLHERAEIHHGFGHLGHLSVQVSSETRSYRETHWPLKAKPRTGMSPDKARGRGHVIPTRTKFGVAPLIESSERRDIFHVEKLRAPSDCYPS